jgi:hypothetical protein
MAFSVALAVFRRMYGEVQQPGTVAPGHDKYDSGLRDRPADLKQTCALAGIPRAEYTLAYQASAGRCAVRPAPGPVGWPRLPAR